MSIIRSISGLRATIPDDLTEKVIISYCDSFSKLFPLGKIAIGRDGRPSGEWIENICTDIFSKLGRDVELLGIVPTPTVQLIVEKNDDISCGIAITASHNPSQWNGLKFINSKGTFIDSVVNNKLWSLVDDFSEITIKTKLGKINHFENPLQKHIDIIKQIPIFSNDLIQQIKNRKFKIVVDAVNASGSKIVPELLRDFNCEVVELFCDNSGEFPHTPEPLPQNLTELCKSVIENEADFGVAVDPDADRLVLIDEKGIPIGEERTICIAIDTVMQNFDLFKISSKNYRKVATVNLSTTMLAEKISESYNGKCTYSPVGEINVVNRMKDENSIIGGEGSGGVILPECHYGRDSLVGIALLLISLTQNNSSLSQLINKFPKFEMQKTKIDFTGNIEELINKVKIEFNSKKIDLQDGIKIIFEDSWVQLRKSNTEPIIRIIAEGKDKLEIENHILKVKGLISEKL